MQLPNRQDLESAAAERLAALAERQRRRLEELLPLWLARPAEWSEVPPDAGRVSPQFWLDMEEETRRDMETIYLLLFAAAAEWHASLAGAPATSRGRLADGALHRRLAAEGAVYAQQRSRASAGHWAQAARQQWERVQLKTGEQLTALRQADQARAAQLPSIVRPLARRDAQQQRIEALQAELDELARQIQESLLRLLGPERAARFAVDETTAAQSAGGDAGVRATIGISPEDLWVNRPHLSKSGPCEVCKPLHLVPRKNWPTDFFDGPGPWVHPLCVCEIQYANMAATAGRGR